MGGARWAPEISPQDDDPHHHAGIALAQCSPGRGVANDALAVGH
ncbi:hypothetical protein [Arthrobacter sp. CDRTa11]|nr:hypothetical protein [Arthrobacter sp. CDRTa11]